MPVVCSKKINREKFFGSFLQKRTAFLLFSGSLDFVLAPGLAESELCA
jgi:hypothetical protein